MPGEKEEEKKAPVEAGETPKPKVKAEPVQKLPAAEKVAQMLKRREDKLQQKQK